MNSKRTYLLWTAMVFALATACNFSSAGQSPEDQTAIAIGRTAVALTEAAGGEDPTLIALGKTALAQTANAGGGGQPVEIASSTPSPTLTSTSGKVTITVSKNTNCRTGPGLNFDLVGIMMVGETAEAIGRNADKTYWVIKLPSNTAKTCWLWYEWATVQGNGDALPIIQSPPTPTMGNNPDFSMMYMGKSSCSPNYYITVQITNTGNIGLESVRLKIYDNTTATWFVHQLDSFRWYSGCGVAGNTQTLVPGATAASSNVLPGHFPYNPATHLLNVNVRVCTQNGLTGMCAEGNFNVTPI